MGNRTSVTLLFAAALLAAGMAGGCAAPAPSKSDPAEHVADDPLGQPALVDPNDKLGQPGDADTKKFDDGTFLNGGM